MSLMQSKSLPQGQWMAPDFQLTGTDGKVYSLNDFSGSKGIVIIFTCNHCPYAQAAWPILIAMSNTYQQRKIQFIAINANDPEAYPEDSFEEMKRRVVEWKIPFPYLYDEDQTVAKAFMAQCTPDIYVFDQKRTLYYHGRINDNWQQPGLVKRQDLAEALDALLINQKPPVVQPPSMGCSIKWKS